MTLIPDTKKLLKEVCHDQGVSRQVLADRLGTSKADVSAKLGSGRNITLLTLEHIADALGQEVVITLRPKS